MLRRFLVSLLSADDSHGSRRRRKALAALQARDWTRAALEYEHLTRTCSRSPGLWNDYGISLQGKGESIPAREAFERALLLDPYLVQARLNLGHLLRESARDYAGAEQQYRKAISIDPGLDGAHAQLGLVLYELGRLEEAIACLQTAEKLHPDDPSPREYRLFAMNADPNHVPELHFTEHVRWAGMLGHRENQRMPGPRADGRLRIGYVSADFREHATACFVLPILESRERTPFEIHCYANQDVEDDITRRIRSHSDAWVPVDRMTDEEVAKRIRRDGIDILVDLAGHTRGNRLGVFARRPAPVQATYLGYLNTTGLEDVDYRLTDSWLDPPGLADSCHTETLLRLDPSCWCFRAPQDAPSVREAPATRSVGPTFGSYNHVAKLNDEVLYLWAEILASVPKARLVCAGVPDDLSAGRIAKRLCSRGIGSDRLTFLPRMDRRAYFDSLSEVDVCLDPFPYNGGATTCDALWMGVPVVTLAGDFGFARTAASLMHAAGLEEFVAVSANAYVKLAARIAADSKWREDLRAGLRERIRSSALMDEGAFIARLAACFEFMARRARAC